MEEMSKMGGLIGWFKRHVGRFLVFPVGGVWFNLQDFHFFSTYFVAFFICMLGQFWFFEQALAQIVLVLLNAFF
jgi:hypothetical protein